MGETHTQRDRQTDKPGCRPPLRFRFPAPPRAALLKPLFLYSDSGPPGPPLFREASLLSLLLGDGCTRGGHAPRPQGQGLESRPCSLGRVTVPLPPPHPSRRFSFGAMVPVPGSLGPGQDCGDSASKSREASGGSRLSSSASFSRWLAASPEAGGWPLRLAGWGGSPQRLAGWGGMAASAWLEAGLARVLFYPTLLYTVFRGRVRGPAHRDWYHRIDHTVLLGALPLRSMTRRVRETAGPGRAGPGAGPRPRRAPRGPR